MLLSLEGLRALLPTYNPRCDEEPAWQKRWVAGHKALPPDAPLPLLETGNPDIPVPSTQTA